MAQDSGSTVDNVTQQLWLDFVPHFFITEKLEFHGDGGFRTTVSDNSWRRYYVRPSVRYHYKDYLKFYGGVGLFYVENQDAFNSFETRPWQGVYARWPRVNSRLLFDHLLRFEERLSWNVDSNDDMNFEFRIRYKLATTLLFCKPCGDQYWSLPVFGEVLLPIEEESNDINKNNFRFGLGAAYKYSRKWSFNLNLIWQQSTSSITDKKAISDQVLQLKVHRLLK